MLAVALDRDEVDFYHWWINSQLDAKKFPWSSPDKAGTDKAQSPLNKLVEFAFKLTKGKFIKGDPMEFHRATGAPYVYMDENRQFYDKEMNPIEHDYRANPGTIVIRINKNESS